MTGYLTTNLQKIKSSGKLSGLEGLPALTWVPHCNSPAIEPPGLENNINVDGRAEWTAVSPASETNSMIRLLQVSGELVQALMNSNELQF